MNVLILGTGHAGSWQMRGLQLGAALGARVTTSPSVADWQWAELVVVVKRAAFQWAAKVHALGLPLVWDAVDFWRQPADNPLSEVEARVLLRQAQDWIRPALTVGTTRAMAEAAGGAYLPHHGHATLVPTDAREVCQVVGYEGNAVFLEAWAPALQAACQARGWTLVINPPNLAEVDILVALRGGVWDGWMCREWKSGVKLVNAILAGRPVIAQPSAAWRDLLPLGLTLETAAHLPAALDAWAPHARRQQVVDLSRSRTHSFTIDTLAAQYADLLKGCRS